MESLLKVVKKDENTQLGEFVSTNFNKIKFHKNGCDVMLEPPFKPAEVKVYMNEDVDFAYAEKCVRHFNQLSQDTICKLLKHSWEYCFKYCEYFEEELPKVEEVSQLLYYIEPFFIYIDKPKSSDIAYTVELHCSWEVEHGMSWIIRNSEVLYVGEGMVHHHLGAWEDLNTYKNDAGNFVFGVPKWE